MINSAVPPFDDIRAREALALATPLENYRNLIGLGVARPPIRGSPRSRSSTTPPWSRSATIPTAAAALVAEYCAEKGTEENTVLGGPSCTDGGSTSSSSGPVPSVVQTRIAEILDEGWKAAGFNVTFDELPQDAQIQQAALGQYNVVLWRQFGAEDPSLDNVWLLCRTIGGISLNWPKYCDEERDALLLEGQLVENGPERIALYQELRPEDQRRLLVHLLRAHALEQRLRARRQRCVRSHGSVRRRVALCDQRSQLVQLDLLRAVT